MVKEPRLGDIIHSHMLGKLGHSPYIYVKCDRCKKRRWISKYLFEKRPPQMCRPCALAFKRGSNHSHWKGGRRQRFGYVVLWISPDDFFYSMATRNGTVFEHRLVMAKHLGRCLHRWESVHHKNGIRDDNRLENLELTNKNQHIRDHSKGYKDGFGKGYADGLKQAHKELDIYKVGG